MATKLRSDQIANETGPYSVVKLDASGQLPGSGGVTNPMTVDLNTGGYNIIGTKLQILQDGALPDTDNRTLGLWLTTIDDITVTSDATIWLSAQLTGGASQSIITIKEPEILIETPLLTIHGQPGNTIDPARIQMAASQGQGTTTIEHSNDAVTNVLFKLPPNNGNAGDVLTNLVGDGIMTWEASITNPMTSPLDTGGFNIITADTTNYGADSIAIRAGAANTVGGGYSAGNLELYAGNSTNGNYAGYVNITAGNATGNYGGFVKIYGGSSTGNYGGYVTIQGGSSTGNYGGYVTIQGGTSSADKGGDAFLIGGTTTAGSGYVAGNAEVLGGSADNGDHGGVVRIQGGRVTGGTGKAGDLTLFGGQNNTNAGPGGNITITPGIGSTNGKIEIHPATAGGYATMDIIDGTGGYRCTFGVGPLGTDTVFLVPPSNGNSGEVLTSTGAGGTNWATITNKMDWKNQWADGTYNPNEVVRDGDWAMVANAITTDRAAPQPIGGPIVAPTTDTAWAVNSAFTGIVKMVHQYTMNDAGWAQSLKIRTAFWNLDTQTRITVRDVTAGTVTVYDNPILKSDDWTTLTMGNDIIPVGNVYEIWYETFNTTNSVAAIEGQWRALQGTTQPPDKIVHIDNLITPTSMRFDYNDNTGADRSTELDAVTVGSIILLEEIADSSRSVEVKVTAVDTAPVGYVTYTVSLIGNGVNDIRDNYDVAVSIVEPISGASSYNYNTDYWTTNNPKFATVTSELYYDGVLQADVNDAYGIEVSFQRAYISPDWDLLAVSSTASAGNVPSGDLGEFTLSTLPDAPSNTNHYALVTDASGGRTVVRSDGTNWKVLVVEGANVA